MNEDIVVSPLLLFPPVGLFQAAAMGHHIRFDVGEHYVKQTIRNRYHILSANGVLTMTIPIVGLKGKKTPTSQVLIDYDEPWVRLHKRALESAYRSSPFFDHYYPEIRESIETHTPRFIDFFEKSFSLWCRLLKFEPTHSFSESFIEDRFDFDLRKPIKDPSDFPKKFHPPEYLQVFSDRFAFQPNLCIVDLLFNEGPAGLSVLKA